MSATKILLIEDDKLIQELIRRFLATHDFEIDIVNDGREALEYLKNTLPALILLDLRLPIVSGAEIIQFVRNELPPSTKIIVVSADKIQSHQLLERRLVNEVFVKPFNHLQLIRAIQSYVSE